MAVRMSHPCFHGTFWFAGHTAKHRCFLDTRAGGGLHMRKVGFFLMAKVTTVTTVFPYTRLPRFLLCPKKLR